MSIIMIYTTENHSFCEKKNKKAKYKVHTIVVCFVIIINYFTSFVLILSAYFYVHLCIAVNT